MEYTRRFHILIILSLFLFSLGVRLTDVNTVGETWDEAAVAGVGSEYLQLIAAGDFSEESWALNREHPPVAKYLYGATKILPATFPSVASWDTEYLPGKQYTVGRLFSMVLGSIAVVFVFLLGKKMYDWRIGLVGATVFSLLPPVMAHTKIIGLETPLMLWILVSVYFALHSRWVLAGLFYGLAIATRFNAFLFGPFFLILAWLYQDRLSIHARLKTLFQKKKTPQWVSTFSPAFVIFVFAFVVLIFTWPWLWHNPIGNLWESMTLSADAPMKEWFLGTLQAPPFYYYDLYFLATTPPLVLFLFGAYAWKLVKEGTREDVLLLAYLAMPFIAVFIPLKQDGMRYLFHLYPALALSAAVGLLYILDRGQRFFSDTSHRVLFLLSGSFVLLTTALSSASVHPYYLDYYNSFFGGQRGVYEHRLFEIGWWGEGVREAVLWVNEYAPEGSSVNYAFSPGHVAPALREDLRLSKGPIDEEFVIYNTYADWYEDITVRQSAYDLVHTVTTSHEVPLVMIYRHKNYAAN